MSYSVLIKGGNVLRGRKFERIDIGIKKDKIADLGDFSGENADLVVDATGKYISPGFIDLTNHSDTHWTLFSQPKQESLLRQGITTILGGNCGASIAPLVRASDIEGIHKWADVTQINTNWRTVEEFFEELSKHPIGVNFATLVGHGTLRRGILGDDARNLTRKEIEEIKFMLKDSLEEGAFGLSTSLAAAHAKFATDAELKELFAIVAEYNGLAKHHLKDEGRNILPAIAEIIGISRESSARTQISHFKILGKSSWNIFPEAINLIETARQEGAKVTLDFFPYTKTGSLLYMLLPPWIIEGGRAKILGSLKDPKMRRETSDYLKSLTLHYDKVIVASTFKDATSVGKTIQELAMSSGLDPEEIIMELLEINELQVSIFNEAISEDNLHKLIAKEYVLVSSDGVGYDLKAKMPFDLPHPRSFGAFPRALQIFTKESDDIKFEDILHKFTQEPAYSLGFKDRGRIEKGFFADLAILDLEKVKSTPDYTASRQEVEGIDWVFVNGKAAVKNGVMSGELGGRIIKRA